MFASEAAAFPPATFSGTGTDIGGSNAAGTVVVDAASRYGRFAALFAEDAEATCVALCRHDRRRLTVDFSAVCKRAGPGAVEHVACQDRVGSVWRIWQVGGWLEVAISGRFVSDRLGIPLRGPIKDGVHKAVLGHCVNFGCLGASRSEKLKDRGLKRKVGYWRLQAKRIARRRRLSYQNRWVYLVESRDAAHG